MTKQKSRILFLIHNKTIFKTFFYHLFRNKEITTDSIEGCNYLAKKIFNYRFDCSFPRSFNEFVCWIKIFYRNELWKKCADKLGSKEFLIDHGFSKYVVKTYKVYKNVSEINLDELPQEFVLKTNHDCGSVFLCDKKKTDFTMVFKKLDQALCRDYGKSKGEWVYESIVPLIFAEEVIKPRVGNVLIDYKFFCFNGQFGWGFTGQNREVDTRFCVFEKDYNIQPVEYIYLKPKKKEIPQKPQSFDEMVNISERISEFLDFVRVDFYDTNKGPKIGELTFFSQSGFGPFTKKEYDFKYREYFRKTNLYSLIRYKK